MIHSRTRHQEILIFSFCSLKDAQQDLRFRQSQRQWHRKYYVRLFSYIRKTKKNLSFIPPCQHQTRMKENLDPTAFQNKKKTSSLEDISLNRLTLQTVRALADLFICGGWSGDREHPLYGLICRVSVMLAGFTSLRRGMGGVATGDLKAIWCRYSTPKLLAEHDTTGFLCSLQCI